LNSTLALINWSRRRAHVEENEGTHSREEGTCRGERGHAEEKEGRLGHTEEVREHIGE